MSKHGPDCPRSRTDVDYAIFLPCNCPPPSLEELAAALAVSEARCTQLETEHTALKELNNWFDKRCLWYANELNAAEARAEAAEARLRAYGRHKDDCFARMNGVIPHERECTCGFSAATEGK